MIKFFRKIRQNLLMENKTGKYLKYAIGEIILVVIGILIALSINNWNENRKQRLIEIETLTQLKKDFLKNVNDLKFNMRMQHQGINSATVLLEHMSTNLPYNDTLSSHFANAFLWTKFVVNTGAYQNLKSRGVELISNTELRDLILIIYEKELNWNASYEAIIIEESETMRNNHGHEFFSELMVADLNQKGLLPGKAKVLDYEKLRVNNKFIFYLNAFLNDSKFHLESNTKGYIEIHMKALKMIDDELLKE
jgi:hypothetical protein